MSRRELLLTIALLCARAYGCDICIIESAHNDADPSLFLPTPIATVICGAIPRSDKVQMAKIKTYFTHGLSDVISAPQDRESYKTIADACSAIGCRLTMPVRSSLKIKHLSLMGTSFQYQGEEYRLGLCGRFQATNATTAIECVKVLRRHGYDIPHECEVSGLESVRIPAKFELISLKPTIIADSTYKLEAVDTVCESLFDFSELTGQDISLCLPADAPLIEKYFDMLTDRGYTIRSIYTVCSEEAEKLLHASLPLDIMLAAFKTEGALVKRVLGGLNSDALLLVSGPFSFTDKIRAEIKSFLAF
jgi:folylpolyglutamate synthase/dihydropteroate synthase